MKIRPPVTQYHLCVEVDIAQRATDERLCELFNVEMEDVPELRARLAIAHARGHVFMPLTHCTAFDPSQGCRGHRTESDVHGPFYRSQYREPE